MMPAIPACLAPREASPAKLPAPPDGWDTHAHLSGPAVLFPHADDRSDTPPDVPLRRPAFVRSSSTLAAGSAPA
jgi:hypothetical protein